MMNPMLPDDRQPGMVRDLMIRTILDWPSPQGERVSYRSQGVCLIVGPTARIGMALECLPAGLRCITFSPETPKDSDPLQSFAGSVTRITGHLGTFRAQVTAGGEARDIGPLSPGDDDLFDLILDLNDTPLLGQEVPPPGYSHCPSSSPREIDRVLSRLARRVGTLYKPRYYHFDESLCAHDRQGVRGCRRCLDSCPADAIGSTGDGNIRVDPYLCRGCGNCTQICPTGALHYAYPERNVTLQRFRQLIAGFNGISDESPGILFFEDNLKQPKRLFDIADQLPSWILPFPLHSIASIGLEVWFAALTSGATSLYMLPPNTAPAGVIDSLSREVSQARRLLGSLGLEQDRIRIITAREIESLTAWESAHVSDSGVKDMASPDDKRTLLLSAMEQLLAPDGEAVSFTGGADAGLGGLTLDESRCTLCQACVTLCPERALSMAGDGSQLRFQQAACVQCALCVNGCPERALQLDRVFHFNPSRSIPVVLFESQERVECMRCRKPFTDRRFLEKSIAVVKKLPSFSADQVDLLKMCPDCRQQEAMKQ